MRNKIFLMFLLSLFAFTGASCAKKSPTQDQTENSSEQAIESIRTLESFKLSVDEVKLSQLKETGDWYYYAKDGKRYVFATQNAYISWFGTQEGKVKESKAEMEKSGLGGQAGFKPGSLLITESDPKIYLVTGGGFISVIDEAVLLEVWGEDWREKVVEIENWFFTAYEYGPVIDEISKLPNIATQPSLEDNLIRP